MNNLLVLTDKNEDYKIELERHNFQNLNINYASSVQTWKPFSKQINIVLGNPNLISEVLDKLPNLKWVQSTFAGNDTLCEFNLRKDYILTGIKDIFGSLMSEYVLAYILGIERNIFIMQQNQKKKIWNPIPYKSLSGMTIGIAGFGSIGQHIAKTVKHFGMKVFALKQTPAESSFADKIFTDNNDDNFYAELDYLVITLPSTPHTKNFLNKRNLNKLKQNTVIINIGRGSVINENDLIEALKQNKLKMAILDVFNQEPLNQNSPLWNMENVIVTPHISAISFPEQIVNIFVENYNRFTNGQQLNYLFDFNKGY